MDYIELNIPVADAARAELLVAELAELPFDSFEEEPGLLKAYIPADLLPDCKASVDALLAERGIEGAHYIKVETQNWNAIWESQFDPVDVEGRLVIRAPFHAPAPGGDFGEIIIMPKMSFGTGHHATTWLMSAEMMDHDLAGKCVLDMGSGTGVLAILAAKMGAAEVDAVDIDEWAFENAMENVATNGVAESVHPIKGDAGAIRGRRYDVILANINRNILLADMPAYVETLNTRGELIVSGILERDIETIERRAIELGLHPAGQRIKEGWAALSFRMKSVK
ncbi:MAG: 50S ribosomal protein L11 methyltransferase [Alistipes sp.]|jgi:ribosomal protein L11 methyltransferase|nr:50S ribosomal protein L11 methyltransferase [Alistipes sp.]